MEEALIEVPTMRRFAGIELVSDFIPVGAVAQHLLAGQARKNHNSFTNKSHVLR